MRTVCPSQSAVDVSCAEVAQGAGERSSLEGRKRRRGYHAAGEALCDDGQQSVRKQMNCDSQLVPARDPEAVSSLWEVMLRPAC